MPKEKLRIAVDIDGTISEFPAFFEVFTAAMKQAGCRIYVVTDRPLGTEDKVEKELKAYRISYDQIKITTNKADFILKEGIEVLFDDVDKYFASLPQSIAVFKIRQKYNFDFVTEMWQS